MRFSALNEKRLYLKVADLVVDHIKTNHLKVGDKLPAERALAADFEVSRPTIREAMVALELSGLIEIKKASGIYVKQTSVDPSTFSLDKGPGPFEILEARRVLESEICGLAAERITDEQLDELSDLLRAMMEDNLSDNPTEQADQAFHTKIAEAAGNSAMLQMVQWLWQLRNGSEISTHFHHQVRMEGIRPIIDDHQKIVTALQARNPEQAKQAMNDHLQRVINNLLARES